MNRNCRSQTNIHQKHNKTSADLLKTSMRNRTCLLQMLKQILNRYQRPNRDPSTNVCIIPADFSPSSALSGTDAALALTSLDLLDPWSGLRGRAEIQDGDGRDDEDLGARRAETPWIGERRRVLGGGESEIELNLGFEAGLKGFWGFRKGFEGERAKAELCILGERS